MAMTGIDTAAATVAVNSQSKPMPVPSRSIDVSRISPAPRASLPAPTDGIASVGSVADASRQPQGRRATLSSRCRRRRAPNRCLASIATTTACDPKRSPMRVISDGSFTAAELMLSLSQPGVKHRRGFVQRANAAAHGERDEQLARRAADGVEQRPALLVRGRNVEQTRFRRRPARACAPRQFGRIAGIAQVQKLGAFDDAPTIDVEAGNDSLGQHFRVPQNCSESSILHRPIFPG